MGVVGSGVAVSVSAGAALAVVARAGKSVHSYTLRSTLDENAGTSGWKMTRSMAWQRVGAASWASWMVSLTLVVSLCAVGARVGPRL